MKRLFAVLVAIVLGISFAEPAVAQLLYTGTTMDDAAEALNLYGGGQAVFDNAAPGNYNSLTEEGITVSTDGGTKFAASNGTLVQGSPPFSSIRFDFGQDVTAFGFFLQYSGTWTLAAYDSVGTFLGSMTSGSLYFSDLGPNSFYGLSTNNGDPRIRWAVLSSTSSHPVTIDAVTYGFHTVAAIPEPSIWALVMVGFGLVGAALRQRAPYGGAQLRKRLVTCSP